MKVLVDRLWPRGLKKSSTYIDFWAKDLAPSISLRNWLNHEENKFQLKYLEELSLNPEIVKKIFEKAENRAIIFIFAATDCLYNQAVVLHDFLENFISIGKT